MKKVKNWLRDRKKWSEFKKGGHVVVIHTTEEDSDTAVDHEGSKFYLKLIDIETYVDIDVDRVFLMSKQQWKKMTTKNLWIGKNDI